MHPLSMIAALAALLVAAPAAAQQEIAAPTEGPTVTVTGRAEVTAVPDVAVLRFGAEAQAPEAAAAQAQVSRTVAQVIEGLAALEIPRNRIQTARLTLHPVYEEPRPDQAGTPRVVAYRAHDSITVEITRLAAIGDVIDRALAAGANTIEGVSFELRADTDARRLAVQQAVQRAAEEAAAVADALAVELGPVEDVRVGGAQLIPPTMQIERAAMEARTPVEPGQVRVTADVTVQYRLIEQ